MSPWRLYSTSGKASPRATFPSAIRRTLRFQSRARHQSVPGSSKSASDVPNTAKGEHKSPEFAQAAWKRLGPLTRPVEAYGRAHRKRPYVTQVISAVTIFALGDMGAQRIGGKDYDPVRTGRSLIIGAVAAIPQFKWLVLSFLNPFPTLPNVMLPASERVSVREPPLTREPRFLYLSRNFNYASRAASLATKVLVNQLVFTPVFGSYFFASHAILSGDSLAGTVDRVRTFVPIQFVNAWKLWPAVMAFNFTFVPIEFRSIVAGLAAIGWQTYLSWLNRMAELQEAAETELRAAVHHAGPATVAAA